MKRNLLILTAVMALAGCGIDPNNQDPTGSSADELQGGGSTGAKSGSGGGGTTNACFVDSQGGATSCKPTATWKQYAVDECAAKGMVVSRIDYADTCGTDLFRYVKFECCPSTPPPPPPPACFVDALGDATSCKSDATWKQYASDECKLKGMVLHDIAYGDSCGAGLDRYVKFECCPSVTPPPPPPPACFAAVVDHKPLCVLDDKLKLEASDVCKAKGQTLVSISYVDACPTAGALPQHMAAEFKCCP